MTPKNNAESGDCLIERQYYSIRMGRNPHSRLDLALLKKLFLNLYCDFGQKGYFQEALGYHCVDAGHINGELGADIGAQVLLRLRKDYLWPIEDSIKTLAEDDLFDLVELLWDWISKPVLGQYHEFNNCGWHYYGFDHDAGRAEFRQEINRLLQDYGDGYELSLTGEIQALADPGLQPLLNAPLPSFDPDNIGVRVEAAKLKFRRYRSSAEDRKDAIRDLADVLEFLRDDASKYLLTKKDEGDLFNIANNFAIRHHNPEQKSDYNKGIWYNWMFYVYLSTIHAAVRVIEETKHRSPASDAQW